MIGVDANLLIRLVLDDDPQQSGLVARLLEDSKDGGIFVSMIVVAEFAWVLKRFYKEEPGVILDMVESLLDARQFTVDRAELVRLALADAREAGCGIADAMIGQVGRFAGATTTLTFDIPAKRLPTMHDATTPQ